MKRWITFLGRGGTVLMTWGLAFLLVSLIPPISTGFSLTFVGSLGPEEVHPLTNVFVLTPQHELRFTVTANGTLTVYILEVSTQILTNWIREYMPELSHGYFYNVTRLEAFFEANPNSIGWQEQMHNETIENSYIPTKVTNVTFVLSNPGSDRVRVYQEANVINIIAPTAKVRNLAQWTIPIGFVLALPSLAQLWKEKTTHRGS